MANRINIWNINHNSIKKCIICEKEFKVKWSHAARRKCCSRECKNKLQSQIIKGNKFNYKGFKTNCLYCKKEFEYSPSKKSKYCSHKCYTEMNKEENNYNWKGDNIGYVGVHHWIVKMKGKPKFCEQCKLSEGKSNYFHWANISGDYRRDVADWKRLCAKCHIGGHNKERVY